MMMQFQKFNIRDERTKNVPVSETQESIPNEAPKEEKPKYTEPVGTVPDEALKQRSLTIRNQ